MSPGHRVYGAAQLGWVVLVVGAFVAMATGISTEVVPGATLPTPVGASAAGAGVLAVAGVLGLGRLRLGAWRSMGRRAGLEPDESTYTLHSRLSRTSPGPHARAHVPDLVATVDGRSVRVTTHYVSRSSGEGGGSSESFTVVRADLAEPVETGTMLGASGEDEELSVPEAVPDAVRFTPVDDQFQVLGADRTEFARQVLSGRVRNLLLDPDYPGGVSIGDKTEALLEVVPDSVGSMLSAVGGESLEATIGRHPANDASAVSISSKGLVSDAADLERRVELVVAVADQVDRVVADRQGA